MRLIEGFLHDHVRSDPPCTVMDVSGARGSCETRPLYPPLPTRSRNSIVGGGSRSRAVNSGVHFRRAVGASSAAAAEHTKMVDMRTCRKIREESKQKRFSR